MITHQLSIPASQTALSFFFESRRRHTRSLRDWSSDVCSSDLSASGSSPRSPATKRAVSASASRVWTTRSEERRVGKECRYRWSPYHLIKRLMVVHVHFLTTLYYYSVLMFSTSVAIF